MWGEGEEEGGQKRKRVGEGVGKRRESKKRKEQEVGEGKKEDGFWEEEWVTGRVAG